MTVHSLGYLVLQSPDVDAWRTFGTGELGMMDASGAAEGALHLKMDEHPFRIAVVPGEENGLVCSGWQVANEETLEGLVARLRDGGYEVCAGTTQDAARRRVNALVRVTDPCGASLELFSGRVYDHVPFVSSVGVSGFVTGVLGLGHVVMYTPDVERSWRFYRDVLGFRLSDVLRRGDSMVRFLHCNPRHHSLALAPGERSQIQHFMVEVDSLDDVGYAYDRFVDAGRRIFMSIGKHTNDHVVSFYAQTPGRFAIEYGCGGLRIDDATWTGGEITTGSFWGHRAPTRPPT